MSVKRNTLESQQSRIERCERGYTVVANGRKDVDPQLISWGRSNNLIVLIDRETKWDNPFKVERHTRAEHERVVALYRDWLPTQEELIAAINELRGRVLQCFCFPWPCHGNVLAEMANGSKTTEEATSPHIEKLSIHCLTLNDLFQSREALNRDAVKGYALLYEEAPEALPPIEVFLHDDALYAVDGFHRVEAAKRAGLEEINAYLHGPTESFDDVLLYAASVNSTHGLHRSNADKRRQIGMALSIKPDWSDRSIAKHCGVYHQLVASVRKDSLDESSSDMQGARRTYRSKHGIVSTMNVEHIGRSRVGDDASVTTDNSDSSVASLPDELQKPMNADTFTATVPQLGNTEQIHTSQDIDVSRPAYVVLPDDLEEAAAILQRRYSDDELCRLTAILQRLSAN